MQYISKNILKYTAGFIWFLTISLGYTILVYTMIYGESSDSTMGLFRLYVEGILLVIPMTIFAIAQKKIKYIWQFIIIGIIVSYGSYLVISNMFFTIVVILLWFLRFIQRTGTGYCVLEDIHFLILIPFCAYFYLTGIQYYEVLQMLVICYVVLVSVAMFNYYGLTRSENYVNLRRNKANMPSGQIIGFGVKNYLTISLVVLLVMIPLIISSYEFVDLNLEFDEVSYDSVEEEMDADSQGTMDLSELFGESDSNPLLEAFWNMIFNIFFIGILVVFAYVFITTLYRMIMKFRTLPIENQGDVIESTFQMDKQVEQSSMKIRLSEFLDFSEEMRIRRRYKRVLKKYNPKPWQTPLEMEFMAELDIPELHEAYEEVRYGKKS